MCQYLDITKGDVDKMIVDIDSNQCGLIYKDDWLNYIMNLPRRNRGKNTRTYYTGILTNSFKDNSSNKSTEGIRKI